MDSLESSQVSQAIEKQLHEQVEIGKCPLLALLCSKSKLLCRAMSSSLGGS